MSEVCTRCSHKHWCCGQLFRQACFCVYDACAVLVAHAIIVLCVCMSVCMCYREGYAANEVTALMCAWGKASNDELLAANFSAVLAQGVIETNNHG